MKIDFEVNEPGLGKNLHEAFTLVNESENPFFEDQAETKTLKKVFINPKISEEKGEKWTFNEGCLSIPDIREDVSRHPLISISYYDEDFNYFEDTFDGLMARVIQHEYDHIEGKLFVDRISPLRKTMLKSRLDSISKGLVKVDYKMRFPFLKKKR